MRHEVTDERISDDGERVLERWSRRKHAARREAAGGSPTAVEQRRAPAPDPSPPDPPKSDADMPPLEMLGAGSDLSDFFSPGVSEGLRRAALRRVFSQARFNVTDGLDDYAGDYTTYRPLGELVTAGLRWHRERLAALERRRQDERLPDTDEASEEASPPHTEGRDLA